MSKAVTVVAAGALILAFSLTIPSEIAAAPKRHREVQYYTITLSDAARGPRLTAKPQTSKGARYFQGLASRFSQGRRPAVERNSTTKSKGSSTRQTTTIQDM
jgi:hypothetical protein